MSTLADLRPGDLMFGPVGGIVPGMFPVGAGQLLLADRKARLSWRRWRKIRHAGVVVEAATAKPAKTAPMGEYLNYKDGDLISYPRLVQAMPKSAEEVELRTDPHWTDQYVYIRPDYARREDPSDVAMVSEARARKIVQAARGYVGTPYNFLTYGAMAARKLRLVLSDRLLRKWISSRSDMMCSQLVDQCLADAGYHVFDDGRLPQDVAPAELFRRLLELPGQFIIPGVTGWLDNSLWPDQKAKAF